MDGHKIRMWLLCKRERDREFEFVLLSFGLQNFMGVLLKKARLVMSETLHHFVVRIK